MNASDMDLPGLRPPWTERAVDGMCLVFALWTVCCHATVAAGGSLRQLLVAAAGMAIAALAAAIGWRRFRGGRPSDPITPEPESARDPNRLHLLRLAGLVLAAGVALAWRMGLSPMLLWWSGLALLSTAGAVFALPGIPRIARPASARGLEPGLVALGLACVVAALLCHRPDIDDAFYINVAVAAVDDPGRALLSSDTLHGMRGLPIHQPMYRIHSFELWNGAIAYLTGARAIAVFHWFTASLVAFFVPLAHARLFRLLTPRRWLWSVAALVFVLLAAGETHRWYGNLAFVRIWQGKAAYLFVFMPLVYSYGIRFATHPTATGWWLLAAAQIAAVGCSSSAIWAAPVGALIAMTCASRPDLRSFRVLVLGAAASLYVLTVGWVLKGEVLALMAPQLAAHPPGEQLAGALDFALGTGRLQGVAVAAILGAWACCGPGLARRFALVAPLGVWLVLLGPYWDDWVSGNLTGPSYWRCMWSLPVPLLISLALTAPLDAGSLPRWRAARVAACVALCLAFVFVPRFSVFDSRNVGAAGVGFRFGPPTLKVPVSPYRWAAELNASVPPGSTVLAPLSVSAWIPTFHHHVHALVVRPPYLYRYREWIPERELLDRISMSQFAAGGVEPPEAHRVFREGLERFSIDAVCLEIHAATHPARPILRQEGFRRTRRGTDYEIWVRS